MNFNFVFRKYKMHCTKVNSSVIRTIKFNLQNVDFFHDELSHWKRISIHNSGMSSCRNVKPSINFNFKLSFFFQSKYQRSDMNFNLIDH